MIKPASVTHCKEHPSWRTALCLLFLLLVCPKLAAAEERLDSSKTRHTYIALKTNMLFDALLIPNIGIDVYVGKNFSVGLNWNYAWWNRRRNNWFWHIYGGDLNARWWFGSKARQKPLSGHHVGLYAQAITYDVEFGRTGYMGGEPGDNMFERVNYGVGVEYGFALPIHRRLNIDFTVGIGYFGGKYYEYKPLDGHYVWQATRVRRWFGPTKAEVSLVWLLGSRNVNKKGGRNGEP